MKPVILPRFVCLLTLLFASFSCEGAGEFRISFEGKDIHHLSWNLGYGDRNTIVATYRLVLEQDGVEVAKLAEGGGTSYGTVSLNGAARQQLEVGKDYRYAFKMRKGTWVYDASGAHLQLGPEEIDALALGVISGRIYAGTPLYDETLTLRADVVNSVGPLTITNDLELHLSGEKMETPVDAVNVNSMGVFELKNARVLGASTCCGTGMCILEGIEFTNTFAWSGRSLRVQSCAFHNGINANGDILVVRNSRFDYVVGGWVLSASEKFCGTEYCELKGNEFYGTEMEVNVGSQSLSISENEFTSPIKLKGSANGTPAIQRNNFYSMGESVFVETGAWPSGDTSFVSGNYFGSPAGPRLVGYPHKYMNQWGTFCSLPASDPPAYQASPSMVHPAEAAPGKRNLPTIWINDYFLGHSVLSFQRRPLRAGKEALAVFDIRCAGPDIAGARFQLKVGDNTLYPVNAGFVVKRAYGDPRLGGPFDNWALSFRIPEMPATNYLMELICDTTGLTEYAGTGVSTMVSEEITVQPGYQRPLRIGIAQLAWGSIPVGGLACRDQGRSIRADFENLLGFHKYEIETEFVGYMHCAPVFEVTRELATWFAAQNLEHRFHQINSKRAASNKLDYIVTVSPVASLTGASGVSFAGLIMNVPHVIMMEDSTPDAFFHEFAHLRGLYAGKEQYAYDLVDEYDNPVKKDSGAFLQGLTVFNPNGYRPGAADVVSHYPFGCAAGNWDKWDIMGAKEPAWLLPSTFASLHDQMRSLLGYSTNALPVKRKAVLEPPVPERVIRLSGLYSVTNIVTTNFNAGAPTIVTNGHARVRPETLRLTQGDDVVASPTGRPIGMVLRCLDSKGASLGTWYCWDYCWTGLTTQPGYWSQAFEVPERAVMYELWKTDDGGYGILQERIAYWTLREGSVTNALRVLDAPQPSDTVAASASAVDLEWNVAASLPGVSTTLLCSKDHGETWIPLGAPVYTNRVSVPLESLSGASNVFFKLITADGFRRFEYVLSNAVSIPAFPPIVQITSPQDGDQGFTNQSWNLIANVTDFSSPLVSQEWVSSIDGLLGTNISLSGVQLSPGSHELTFTASDVRGFSATQRVNVIVGNHSTWDLRLAEESLAINRPGTASHVKRQLIPGVTNMLTLTLRNQGCSNSTLISLYAQGPAGTEQLVATNTLAWAPFETVAWSGPYLPVGQGSYRIRAVISPLDVVDPNASNNEYTWIFTNQPPELNNIVVDVVLNQSNVTINLEAADPNGDPLTYSISRSPEHGGLTLNGSLCQYAPDFSTNYDSFEYVVSDGQMSRAGVARINIEEPLQPPQITSTNYIVGVQGEPINFQVQALHRPDYFSFSGLPQGWEPNIVSGRITGVTTRPGAFAGTISAANRGGSTSQNINIYIYPGVPGLLSPSYKVIVRGREFRYETVASRTPTNFAALNLPPGLEMNATNGVISGTPTTAGNYTVTLRMYNEYGLGMGSITLIVAEPELAQDYFECASVLTGNNISLQGNNSYATREANEPDHAAQFSPQAGSIWWSWTAPTNGFVQVDTRGSVFDTTLAVYTGDQMTNLVLVAGNDNYDRTEMISVAGFWAVSNTTYLVALDGVSKGDYQFHLRYIKAPFMLGPLLVDGGVNRFVEFHIQATNNPSRYFVNGLPDGFSVDANTGRVSGSTQAQFDDHLVVGAANAFGTNTIRTRLRISLQPTVTARLEVQTIGRGSVSPNYSNAMLEIGRAYTMTAQPAVGWAFSGWSGSIVTNRAALTFVMASNLSFTANFVDATKPALNIISPPPNSRVSNALCTVRGKASDNGLFHVRFQLNGSQWQEVQGTSNWTANVTLAPGTNLFCAYAMDSFGNTSVTNTINLVYVPCGILQVQKTGQGAISPNLNNKLLVFGSNYAMTATGTNGFRFEQWLVSTNWGDSITVTNKELRFTMQSNLTIQAVFFDTNRPTLAITNVASGKRISNEVFTVRGRAKDNDAISNLYYRLNAGAWIVADGTNAWAASVTLNQPTNLFQAYVADRCGNRSVTNSVIITYVPSAVLQVQRVGQGSITPNLNNVRLALGTNYAMKATGTNGHRFDRWVLSTNWQGALAITNPAFRFTMCSNLTVQAVFADTNRPTLQVISPVSNQRFTNATTLARGTAKDNVGITNVWCRLNGGSWQQATGTTKWTNTLTLIPGTNLFHVYAEDVAGNRSTTNLVRVIFKMPAMALALPSIITRQSEAGLSLQIQSEEPTFQVQYTEDLIHWQTLGTFTNEGSLFEIPIGENNKASQRFYRIKPKQ